MDNRQQLIRQRIMDSLQQPSVDQQLQDAKDQEKKNLILTAIGRALSTAAAAPAIAKGGRASDLSLYDALDANSRSRTKQAMDEANINRNNALAAGDIESQLAKENSTAEAMKQDQARQVFEQSLKNKQFDLESKKFNKDVKDTADQRALEKEKLGLAQVKQVTPAQQAFEKTAAEDIANYQTQGGAQAIDQTLASLEGIKKELEANKNLTGGPLDKLAAILGPGAERARDVMFPEQVAVKQKIQQAVLPGMKAMFPGQTSDKELKTFMELAWDDKLSPAENAAKLQVQIDRLRTRKDSLGSMTQNLQETGKISPAPAKPAATQPLSPAEQDELKRLRAKYGR